jgi:hypothetical protein
MIINENWLALRTHLAHKGKAISPSRIVSIPTCILPAATLRSFHNNSTSVYVSIVVIRNFCLKLCNLCCPVSKPQVNVAHYLSFWDFSEQWESYLVVNLSRTVRY